MAQEFSIGAASSAEPRTSTRWIVVALGFIVTFLDGFDLLLLPSLIPTLAGEWHVGPKSFAVALTLTSIGAAIGLLSSGWMASRMSARKLLAFGCGWFGLWTMACSFVLDLQSTGVISVLRLLIGYGLGIVVPVAVGVATRHSVASQRALVSVLVSTGFGVGATACGFVAGPLIRSIGAGGFFQVGGVLPIACAILALVLLPVDDGERANGAGKPSAGQTRIAYLLEPQHRGTSLLLWTYSFSVFFANFMLTSWIAALLASQGFSATDAPLGVAYFAMGSLLGSFALMALVKLFDIRPVMLLMAAIATVSVALIGLGNFPPKTMLLLLGGVGFGVGAGQIGHITLAVSYYPEVLRMTGIGLSSALGRVGAIAGPAAGGILLAAGVGSSQIILAVAGPLALACMAGALLWRANVRGGKADA